MQFDSFSQGGCFPIGVRRPQRCRTIPDLVIVGGFTDDAITTTDAGGSPNNATRWNGETALIIPQLLALNSPGLRPQRCRFRRALQGSTDSSPTGNGGRNWHHAASCWARPRRQSRFPPTNSKVPKSVPKLCPVCGCGRMIRLAFVPSAHSPASSPHSDSS